MLLSDEIKVEEEDEEEDDNSLLQERNENKEENNKEKKKKKRSALLEGDMWHWKVGGFSVESQFNKMQVYNRTCILTFIIN